MAKRLTNKTVAELVSASTPHQGERFQAEEWILKQVQDDAEGSISHPCAI